MVEAAVESVLRACRGQILVSAGDCRRGECKQLGNVAKLAGNQCSQRCRHCRALQLRMHCCRWSGRGDSRHSLHCCYRCCCYCCCWRCWCGWRCGWWSHRGAQLIKQLESGCVQLMVRGTQNERMSWQFAWKDVEYAHASWRDRASADKRTPRQGEAPCSDSG
ncbi:hypothetical protein GQ42DRAFT_34437 [Ramicandelaber brevisporus]|nr:hypothetical protein GQ42DRAFT_34437 [Ramicandelaber brevisporus]